MSNSFNIPYGKQDITKSDIDAVIDALKGDFLTQGPKIVEFEKNFAAYVGSKYAVALSNGTAALHLGLIALGVSDGDRIITTPITFSASANVALYCGAEVHFADIDPDSYVISLVEVEKLLMKHPKGYYKAIVPVDFGGYPVNTQSLRVLADKYSVAILEDACHAPGAYFIDSDARQERSGACTYSDATAFSFHPVKHIAAGEGGMLTTNNEEIYKRVAILRTHGITKEDMELDFPNASDQGTWYYEMQELGYNYRITDIQAALANNQLAKADKGIARRQEIAKKYRKAFKGTAIKSQLFDENYFNAHHLFVIEVENRKELYDKLRSYNIFSQIHYIPVHLLPYYRKLGWNVGDFPAAEKYYEHCISLPMYPTLTDEEQDFVIEKIIGFINA